MIFIATPSKGLVSARHMLSVVNLVKGIPNIEYMIQLGADITNNRYLLIKKAQELKATHIFFIDDDLVFSSRENPLIKLLSHGKDIVGADYNFRQLPFQSMTTPLTEKSDGLYKCKAIPSGFMLIKMSVFDKISLPYFSFDRNTNGEVIVSDDVYFCDKARSAGFDIWCDSTIKVGHIGEFVY